MSRQKDQRVRNAVKKLNEIRHRQEKKIDILCNDMVGAHREFVDQLKVTTFSIGFYESILGVNNLQSLMNASTGFVRDNIAGSTVAAFLLDDDGFNLHMADDDYPIEVDQPRLEVWFTLKVVEAICRSRSICSLRDMLEMGLSVQDTTELSQISAVAIPLGRFGKGTGFILIYRNSGSELGEQDLQKLRSITSGLYQAIESTQKHTQAS